MTEPELSWIGAALTSARPKAVGALLRYFRNFFGVKGALLMELGRAEEARRAFVQAITLANTAAEAAHIRIHLDRLIRDATSGREASATRRTRMLRNPIKS